MSPHSSISSRLSSVFDTTDNTDNYTEPPTAPPSCVDEGSEYDLKPPSISLNPLETLADRFFSKEHLDLILRDVSLSTRFTKFVRQYRPHLVASLKSYLETSNATAAVDTLVNDALPAYITHRFTHLVTDTLVKEITGNSAPLMKEMIPSLAEVYCLTDASIPGNPIIYASEEFYNTSQYSRDYVIGRNCRFLRGPRTSQPSVQRLVEALTSGQEVTETILNYRMDGTPFMNLLLIAPLYDNKGVVRYFLGCQIDVTALVEGGRGLESFAQLLAQDRSSSRCDERSRRGSLGLTLDDEETGSIRARSRGRKILGMEESAAERALWSDTNLGPSGRLPGVYQNYVLVRPYPSLQITFTSPALRIPGLVQTKFLDRIGGPQQVREGIFDSLKQGTAVTAKISWLPNGNASDDATLDGKSRWIHCTPLLGADDKVGVWMIVMVEKEEVTGQLTRGPTPDVLAGSSSPQPIGAASPKFTSDRLFTEYLRREGKSPCLSRSPAISFRSGSNKWGTLPSRPT